MSDYLFALPSVLEGIGRNIDLFGLLNVYNSSGNEISADEKAFAADLVALKNDFDTVLHSLNAV
ncbi:MAG: hypothetical protein LBJ86_01250 [Spirochaetaceae bacterium]|jgi:hypothetical protein|nr:hypothetical protein [Spirochaetaceae bacterium]